jgi:hypothetical protein
MSLLTTFLRTLPGPEPFFIDFLLVGGGGGGGGASVTKGGGGGGGGGFLETMQFNVTPGSIYQISVGLGGLASTATSPAQNGGNTVFGVYVAYGGGKGGSNGAGTTEFYAGGNGASGGGGYGKFNNIATPGGSAIYGTQGYAGQIGTDLSQGTSYNQGGAGGGAGGIAGTGFSNKNGGPGRQSTITGLYYGGGGGGLRGTNSLYWGDGGTGGGGLAGSSSRATQGTDGLGGGGGAVQGTENSSKRGGNGTIVFRIPDTQTANFSGNVSFTYNESGGYKVYTITTATIGQTVVFG